MAEKEFKIQNGLRVLEEAYFESNVEVIGSLIVGNTVIDANSISGSNSLVEGLYININNNVISVDKESMISGISGSNLFYNPISDTLDVSTNSLSYALAGYGLQGSGNHYIDVNTNVIATQAYVDSAVAGVDINAQALAGDGLSYDNVSDHLDISYTAIADNLVGYGLQIGNIAYQLEVNTNVIATQAYVDSLVSAGSGSIEIVNVSGGSHVVSSYDIGKLIEIESSTPVNVVVYAEWYDNIPVGSQINILQTGDGQVSFIGESGVTLNGTPGLKLRDKWSLATLIKRASSVWIVVGDLSS